MKILSIDFDIIMAPSIGFYNNLVGEEDPVEDYVEQFSFITNLPADLYIYEYLTRCILLSLQHNVKKIYFIDGHDKIINAIPKDEPVEIINVDHHHDIGYEIENWRLPLLTPNCGNWVKYLKDRKMIDKYTWIHNEEFDPVNEDGEKYLDKEVSLSKINLEKIAKEIDCLVICASYEWVPPIYHPLYQTWQTLCELAVTNPFIDKIEIL